jgi:hypothetical protein
MRPLLVKILRPTSSTAANVIIASLLGFIFIILLLVLFSPGIVKVTVNNWFEQRGFTSSIEVVEIKLLDSQFEIRNIKAKKNDGRSLNIGKAYLDFSWTPLKDQQFLITGIELTDISVSVRKHNEELYLSGIQLAGGSGSGKPAKPEAPRKENDADKLPWKVSLEKLQLSNINICYEQTINDASNDEGNPVVANDVCLNLGGLDWLGEVDYSLTPDQTKHPFHLNGEISLQDIKLTNNYFDNKALSYDYVIVREIAIKLHDEPNPDIPTLLPMKTDSLVLKGIDSCYQKSKSGNRTNPLDGYCFLLDRLDWAGASGYSPASSLEGVPSLHVDGTLSLEDVSIVNTHLQRHALDIGKLQFNRMFISSIHDISLNEFSIDNLSVLKKNNGDNHAVTSFDKFSIYEVNVENLNKLSINRIFLDGLQVSYEKLKNGEMEHVQWLPQENEEIDQSASSVPDKTESESADPFNYSINAIDIVNSKSISFVDHSLSEDFIATLSDVNINVQNIDSSKPLQNTQHRFKAKIYEYGSIETSGSISPLAPDITFDVEGKIRGLDLTKFNPHVKPAIGHIIESGQLDSDLVLKSVKGQLDSNVDLTLHHFELESLSKEATEELNETFGLPLNPSLALIRERDGSININVDIDGDADNPAFNPVEIVTRAISTSIAKAVVVFYTPYGLIVGADALFDLATALKFDPVIFDAGSAELNAGNIGEFSNLSKLLTERPQVHIRLCGSTNDNDAAALFDIKREKDKEYLLSEEQLDQLAALAKKRATITKQHLLDKENITADFGCVRC